MINNNILTAGAFILSMLVLLAATNINSNEVILDPHPKTLSGVVVDADTEEVIPNAIVYLKKNNDDGMQADRTQQQQQQQQDRAVGLEEDMIDETTTNQNGEFEFDNIEELLAQLGNQDRGHEQQQQQQQDQQQQLTLERDDETVILVVEAPGYETEEKEIKLSEYLEDSADEKEAMESDQYSDQDQDRDQDRDKDKDKIKIELTRSN